MFSKRFLLTFTSLSASLFFAHSLPAQVEPTPETPQGLSLEYFKYRDRVYSWSRKTELGEQVQLDTALKYTYSPDTFARLRIDIHPQEDTFEGKTSRLEFLLNHRVQHFTGQLDLDLEGQDGDTGGIAVGPDVDSFRTFLSYGPSEQIQINFYPYSFGGEVGDEFDTWDVTRIYYVTGSPDVLQEVVLGDERIEARTIPGFGFQYKPYERLMISGAAGVATYLYPADSGFDYFDNITLSRWVRKEDTGYRMAVGYRGDGFTSLLEHVGHTQADETGSLLASATALLASASTGPMFFETEIVHSTAGSRAFNVDETSTWFETENPASPTAPKAIFLDYDGNPQDWLGKSDLAWMLKTGIRAGAFNPYLSYKFQGEHFVYRDLESAHKLRTNDSSKSHGGLHRVALGAHIFSGDLEIQPQIEWMRAQNKVFGSSSDIREDRFLSQFEKENFLLTLMVSYAFDVESNLRPY